MRAFVVGAVCLVAACPGFAQPIPIQGTPALNTTITLSSPALTTGSINSSGGTLNLPGTSATSNPTINTIGGSILLRAGAGLTTSAAPLITSNIRLVPSTVSLTPAASSLLTSDMQRATLNAPVPMQAAQPHAFPQLRENVYVQPGTALTTATAARQAVVIDGRIRFTQ